MLNAYAVIAKIKAKQAIHSLDISLVTLDLGLDTFTHHAIANYFVVTTLKSILQSRLLQF